MLDPQWDTLSLSQHEATHFWACFARAEFALKATRYAIRGHGDWAKANWDKFAADVAGAVQANADQAVVDAIAYLLAHPPKRQIVREERAHYEPKARASSKATRVEQALEYVRRVRNNLFHGGKYFEEDVSNRDRKLLNASLVLLEICLKVHADVWAAYVHGDA